MAVNGLIYSVDSCRRILKSFRDVEGADRSLVPRGKGVLRMETPNTQEAANTGMCLTILDTGNHRLQSAVMIRTATNTENDGYWLFERKPKDEWKPSYGNRADVNPLARRL